MIDVEVPSMSVVVREVARRLRAGELDPSTIELAAKSLESMADLYDQQSALYQKALDLIRRSSWSGS